MEHQSMSCKLLVLKIASRCNLNCTYCYVYNVGDTTYLKQPKVMSEATVVALLQRVREHCLNHGVSKFAFVFHGGEPLLAGVDFFRFFVAEANKQLLPEIGPMYCIQTNGTLLTPEWCEVLGELNIPIGISLDGSKEINDMYRVDHKGRGSYDEVIRGFNIAQNSHHTKIKPGLLSVMNIDADPVETYEHLKSLNVRAVDFLFLEATHDTRPYKKETDLRLTPYADWLITIFDIWFNEPEKPFSIRLFESYISAIFGIPEGLDTIGDAKNEVLVIESDGSIEPIGSLKVCGHGFTKDDANVHSHSLDEALQTDLASLYHHSGQKLCATCTKCPIKKVCGAGYLPHRWSKNNGFDNPSVYCSDLMKLITHIQNKVIASFTPSVRKTMGINPLTFVELDELMEPYYGLHLNEVDEELMYKDNAQG